MYGLSHRGVDTDRGFTLVELMVVVTIIGILAAIGIPRVQAYLRSSETAEVSLNAGRLVGLIKAYRDTAGKTPAEIVTDLDTKQVTPAGAAGELGDMIAAATIPSDAKFSYTVSAIVASSGPLSGEAVVCLKATGATASSNPGGEVLYSEVRTSSVGWDGNVNRMNFVSSATPSVGGYCTATGVAQAACTNCPP